MVFVRSECSLMAEILIEKMFSGSEVNHPGVYMATHKHHREKREKKIASKSFCFFLNVLLWTIRKVMVINIPNMINTLMMVHEKSVNDGLRNCCISNMEILL